MDLRQYFQDKQISIKEIAQRTGYTYGYMVELLNGTEPLSDRAKFRLISAFPDLSLFFLSTEEKSHEIKEIKVA